MLGRPTAALLACLAALALAGCGGGSKKALASLGADCLAGRDAACQSGTCLVLDSSTAYCSQSCAAQKDCPDGYLCLAAAGQSGNVCQARGAGGVCGSDDDCPAGLHCDATGGRCYVPVTRSACGSCTSDKQCGTGGVCHSEGSESFCAPACGAGCAAGYTCTSGQCLPSGGSCRGGRALCASCAGDLECGKPGDLCVRNLISEESFCAKACSADADCPKSFSCLDLSGAGNGPKQCVPISGTCQGYCDSTDPATVQRECGLGSACDLTNRACVRSTDGTLCAACQSDDDCAKASAGNRCLVNRTQGSPFFGERFCGVDCTLGTCTGAGCQPDATKCQPGFTCTGIGANAGWPFQCAPTRGSCEGGFGKLGDSCASHGAADCASGICGQYGLEQRCTLSCANDAACGDARWRCCAAVGSDKFDCNAAPGASGGVCAPVGGSFGDDCSPGHPPCQDGYCLDIGTAQLCTKACTPGGSGVCQTGFSCQPAQLIASDGTTTSGVNVCFPDGGGAVGSACTFGPAACKSHLCIKKDSGNVCTATCTANSDCPTDWSCGQTQTVGGTTVNVCLPPGTTP